LWRDLKQLASRANARRLFIGTTAMPKTKQTSRRRLQHGFVRDHLAIYDGATQVGTLVKVDADFCAFDMQGELVGTFSTLRDAARSLPKVESTS
jgi:hypothetical protein